MNTKVLAQRRSLFWRIHLWAAFIATPFALSGALTGILYIFTPQIESLMHGHLDRVTPSATRLPLDTVVDRARQAAPEGATLRYVVTPEAEGTSVRAYFSAPKAALGQAGGAQSGHAGHEAPATAPAQTGSERAGIGTQDTPSAVQKNGHQGHSDSRFPQGSIVYINPYNGDVLGTHGEMDRFDTWAKRLHSSLLQGNDWRWMLELSTSWMLVMLLTGVYLWWPRGDQKAFPQPGVGGRMGWRQWHAFSGVLLSAITLVILTTGLTWSRQAGEQIKSAADWVGQSTPDAPKELRSEPMPGQSPLGWQAVWEAARAQAPSISYQINPPKRADDLWRISNFDRAQPTKRFTLMLDGYSGQRRYYHGWESFTLFNKATAVGIPFHRGQFGWWNQSLLLVFGVGVVWWLVSGWVMFVKRNRQGLLGLPRVLPGAWRSLPAGAWVSAVVLLVAMPLLALSAVGIAGAEAWMAWRAAQKLPVT